jgi:hypothetical protein
VTNNVRFGTRYNNSAAGFFSGKMDDVRIYNRALSAQEIAQLYALGGGHIDESNNVAVSSGLVGYWPFDGNTTNWKTNTAQDTSGNGNTGQLISMSTTTSTVPGKIGSALSFNGANQYVKTTANGSTFLNYPLTVSVWLKSKSSGPADFLVPLGIYNGPGAHNGWVIETYQNKYTFFYAQSGSNLINGEISGSLGGPTTTSWRHFVAVVTTSGTQLYSNGVPTQFIPWTGTPGQPTTSNVLTIGNTATGSLFFPGTIDDVRIYNRALSAQEVQQLYLAGK